MKNIFTILNLSNMKDQLKSTCFRFPVTVGITIIIAFLLLLGLHGDFTQAIDDHLIRGIFAGIVAFFFSIGFYLLGESKDYLKGKNNLIQILPILYSSLFFVFFQNSFNSLEEIIFFILSLIGIIGFLYFAPYVKNILNNNGKQSVYYTYFYNISVIILISFILGGVLFGLGAIGITAVHTLFDLTGYFTNEIYGDWAILALSLITPLFALSKIPKKREFNSNYFNENPFFSFLVKYIAIPFIYIYFIILYLYSAKVLMNFGDWPKGEVTWMVIGFSIFGYLIYIFSYIFEEKNSFIKAFRKYFPYAVIPQIFMLFYAIYLRINQYDITINRYLVVVFGIWLLLISIYYGLSKKKYLGNLIVLLTLFTVIISVGPWSVYQLPESRQLERLKNNLIEANILQNGKIVPLNKYNQIDNDLSKQIYDGIDYLCNFDNCNEIIKLFPEISQEVKDQEEKKRLENIKNYPDNDYYDKKSEPSSWKYVNEITETIKVESYSRYDSVNNRPTIYFSTNHNKIFPLNTSGSKNLYKIDIYSYENDSNSNYDKESDMIIIKNNNSIITKIALSEIKEKLLSEYKDNRNNELNTEDMTFNISNSYGDFSLILTSLNIKNPEYTGKNNDFYINIDGYLLER